MEMGMDGLDLPALIEATSRFPSLPAVPSDAAVKEFLDRYPLPVLFSVLDGARESSELSNLIVSTLERIFKTDCGTSEIPSSLSYAGVGLSADSPLTRRMTCLAISRMLEKRGSEDGVELLSFTQNNLLFPLLTAIADKDATVAFAAAGAIEHLAKSPAGLELLFGAKGAGVEQLKKLATYGSSLVRIRVFTVVAAVFGYSEVAATAIKQSGFLRILDAELDNSSDVLALLNALELLYELARTPNGANFVFGGNAIQRLTSIIGNNAVDPMLRAQAMMIGARLISNDNSSMSPIALEGAKRIVQAIDSIMGTLKDIQIGEKIAAIDALGQIGIYNQGAELLLYGSHPVAWHVIEASFSRKGGDLQKVGIHALASIAGAERAGGPFLSDQAESCLRDLMFLAAEGSSKRSPSDLLMWILQQAPDVRLAAYRLVVPLVVRLWCLREICCNKELINFITDPHTEHSKEGMEWRHACCVAINSSIIGTGYRADSSMIESIEQLQAAVRRGPYLAKEQIEARPIVATQERF